jgi:hypothetical protein
MTEKQMNIAIAESLGFEDIHFSPKKYYERRTTIDFHCLVGTLPHPDHNHPEEGLTYVPDYCNDLNAMHEVEIAIAPELDEEWLGWMVSVTTVDIGIHHIRATARQRAEAYLRTIGRFEDE